MKLVYRAVLGLMISCPCYSGRAQSRVEVGKVLNYRQSVIPVGADNYLFSTYYYNSRKAYNMKGFVIGNAPYDIVSLKYNPIGTSYALLSQKKQKAVVEIFDAWQVGHRLFELKNIAQPTAVCYTRDSRRFFVAELSGTLHVLETRQYTPVMQWHVSPNTNRLVASMNGYYLAAATDNNVTIINQETGSVRASIPIVGKISSIAFSPDVSMFGVLTENGSLTLYETKNFTQIAGFVFAGDTHSFDFHPEGKYVTVLNGDKQIVFQNLTDESDHPFLTEIDGGMSYVRYLQDGKRQIYLTYNTSDAIKYKQLKGLSPNYTKMLAEELNARMNEWAKMRPDETMEEFRARVNEESRLKQVRLFEQEIATRMADGLVTQSEVRLGSYNPETNMLTLAFDNMPQIYLTVPEDEMSLFTNTGNLEFRDVIYGLTKNDKFEITYAMVFNKQNGKSYEFNNLSRQSLDFLTTDDNFVPIELVQQSGMEDVRLQAIKDDVVKLATQNALISEHTNIQVSTNVVPEVDATGRRITNEHINFSYTVDGDYSEREDFPAGKYKIEQSHAALSMLDIVTRAFEQDFAQYIKSGKKLIVKVTGSADALKINGVIAYDGIYGNFDNEPYYLNGELNALTVSSQTGIRKNEQLAFMRAIGVKDYIQKHISSLQSMNVDYQYHVELAEGTGGQYRRIGVEFVFVDAFSN